MIDATLPIVTDLIRDAATPVVGSSTDYDQLLEFIGDARFVLLGEASHGTHEFYRHRAQITKRLIQEKGFTVVAVEADWPDAYRVNRYVRGASADADARRSAGWVQTVSSMDVAQCGRAGFRRLAALVQRLAAHGQPKGRVLWTRPIQLACLD